MMKPRLFVAMAAAVFVTAACHGNSPEAEAERQASVDRASADSQFLDLEVPDEGGQGCDSDDCTVDWFKEHTEERAKVLKECTKNLHEFASSVQCVNALKAENKVSAEAVPDQGEFLDLDPEN